MVRPDFGMTLVDRDVPRVHRDDLGPGIDSGRSRRSKVLDRE